MIKPTKGDEGRRVVVKIGRIEYHGTLMWVSLVPMHPVRPDSGECVAISLRYDGTDFDLKIFAQDDGEFPDVSFEEPRL